MMADETMRSLESFGPGTLLWAQPKGSRRHFELRAGDDLFATLAWERWYSDRALGRAAGREWAFNRKGVWNRRGLAEEVSTGALVAEAPYTWRGPAAIVFHDERRYELRPANTWRTKWELLDPNEFPVFHFHMRNKLLKYETEVALTPDATYARDLPLLLLFCWYLVYLTNQDAAAAAS